MTSAVYVIVNVSSGRKYVGSTKDVERRFKDHVTLLSRGLHHCRHLQRAWDIHGKDYFEFKLVEIVDVDRLTEREQFHLSAASLVYNASRFVVRPMLGRKMSDETKAKLRACNIGRKHSVQTKQRMSAARKGHATSEVTRTKIGARSYVGQNVGHRHTLESRAKMSVARKGCVFSEQHKAALRAAKARQWGQSTK